MSFPKIDRASDYYADHKQSGWVVHDDWGSILGWYTTRHDALDAALRRAEMLYKDAKSTCDIYESVLSFSEPRV